MRSRIGCARRSGSSVSLDEAFIGTIHGFCQSLLRRHPIEAGLPPKFTTADELTSGAMADERAEQAVQTLYNLAQKKQAIEEALMVIASFGAMRFLPELVRAIDNDWLRFARFQARYANVDRRGPCRRDAHARPRRPRPAVSVGQRR